MNRIHDLLSHQRAALVDAKDHSLKTSKKVTVQRRRLAHLPTIEGHSTKMPHRIHSEKKQQMASYMIQDTDKVNQHLGDMHVT